MSRLSLRLLLPAAALFASTAFAVSGFKPVAATAAPPPVIDIMAFDYGFDAPDVLPAGPVTIRLMNHGQELHHAQLMRLNDGVTFDQFAQALQAEGDGALRLVQMPGGAGAIDPGLTSEVTLTLAPGDYAVACFVAGPDGVPHLAKGMLKPLTVSSTTTEQPALPEEAGTLTMRDFSFDIPDQVRAGRVTYRVVNDGPQPHEMNILKLAPGATMDQVAAWAQDPSTPPPFEAVGGMNGLTPGADGLMTVDLEPGSYIAICNIPDPATGLPHSQLGMVHPFTVD
jgi:uncharacterized cupredoxin-like copper-binding protein